MYKSVQECLDPRITYFNTIDDYLDYCDTAGVKPQISYTLGELKNWIGPIGNYVFVDDQAKLITRNYTQYPSIVQIYGIPHFTSYASYAGAIQPSDATYYVVPGTEYRYGSELLQNLFLDAQVSKLAQEIRSDLNNAYADYGKTIGYGQIWREDPRRFYTIRIGTMKFDAGILFRQRSAAGINCPGWWTFDPNSGPTFTPFKFQDGPTNSIWNAPLAIPSGFEVALETNNLGDNNLVIRSVTGTSNSTVLTDSQKIEVIYQYVRKNS